MDTAKKVWMDGRLIPWPEATVHVSAHAIHYGSSIFEGMRAYDHPNGPAVFRLPEHVDRLWASSRLYRLPIPFSPLEISAAIGETVLANGFRVCYLRPVVFRGSGTFQVDGRNCPTHVSILAIDMGRYLGADALDKGVRAGVSSWRRLAPGTAFASAKIGGQYVNSQFIAMEAHDRGFDEGIALDVSGVVSEGSGENVFLVRNGTLATPPLESSILDGITRRSVLTLASDLGIDVAVEVFPRDRLYLADEAFFTGTAAEITPIVEIDGQRIGDGRPGPITRRLASAFFDIVEGRAPDRHGWLTHVWFGGTHANRALRHHASRRDAAGRPLAVSGRQAEDLVPAR